MFEFLVGISPVITSSVLTKWRGVEGFKKMIPLEEDQNNLLPLVLLHNHFSSTFT